jgi:hypothetical protein
MNTGWFESVAEAERRARRVLLGHGSIRDLTQADLLHSRARRAHAVDPRAGVASVAYHRLNQVRVESKETNVREDR